MSNPDPALRSWSAACPPVVLLGGLNLLRPLGWAGIPVIVATADGNAAVLASRFCTAHAILPGLDDPAGVADTLRDLGQRLAGNLGQRVPLFCGSDDTLSLLQVYREALEPYFILLLNEEGLARTLLDKDLFQTLAASRGVSVPRALSWASVGDFDGPVLVKPKVKIAWDSSPMRLQLFEDGAKARVFASGHEVASDPAARQMKDQLLFQEYIPGGDGDLWSFHGFATEEGEVLAWFVGHKLRTYPALTGMSSFLELAHDDELARTGHDVVARLGLQGVFKIDFKKDARTGRFRALEVNARFNLWHHLGARNGINLPLVAYEYLVYGRRPAPRAHETRFRWLCLDLDLRAGRDLASRNELAAAAWLWSILRTRKVYNVFAWSDPRPFFRDMARRARSLRRPPARLFRWLYTAS